MVIKSEHSKYLEIVSHFWKVLILQQNLKKIDSLATLGISQKQKNGICAYFAACDTILNKQELSEKIMWIRSDKWLRFKTSVCAG